MEFKLHSNFTETLCHTTSLLNDTWRNLTSFLCD